MPDVRPIDANALCKTIIKAIIIAREWENKARENKDKYGVNCAIDAKWTSIAMLYGVSSAPTIDARPVKYGKWEHGRCTECGKSLEDLFSGEFYYDDEDVIFCPHCGAEMRGGDYESNS